MSLSTVDDVLRDIENEKFLFSATAKNASDRMKTTQQTLIKELIIEATVPKNQLEMDKMTKGLSVLMGIAIGGIIDRLTNSIEGSIGLYNYLIPEYASIYACRLVDLMKGSQAIFFLEDCLKLGVYEAIRSWDLDPNTAQASVYQNIPTGYISHFICKPVSIKREEANKTNKTKLIRIFPRKALDKN